MHKQLFLLRNSIAAAYLGDILVLLMIYQKKGLVFTVVWTFKHSKCEFGNKRSSFWLTINQVLQPNEKKLKSIRNFSTLTYTYEVKRFLLTGFFLHVMQLGENSKRSLHRFERKSPYIILQLCDSKKPDLLDAIWEYLVCYFKRKKTTKYI